MVGPWLWCSWQSGRFRYQRTPVRIQSLATFIEHFFTAMAHLKKIYKSSSVKNSICNQVDSSSNLDSNKELDFYIKILLSVLFHSVFKKTIQFCMKYINANFIKMWLRPFD